MADLDGAVLAGGASRRFGADKALAREGGARLVDAVGRALAPWCRSVRVVRRSGQAPLTGWTVVVGEEGEDHHPLWGLAVALDAATAARVIVAPCDLVGLTGAHVGLLLAAVGDGEGVAWDGERVHPLLGVYGRHRAIGARLAAASGVSVRSFAAALPRVLLPERALLNLNRPSGLG